MAFATCHLESSLIAVFHVHMSSIKLPDFLFFGKKWDFFEARQGLLLLRPGRKEEGTFPIAVAQ